MTNGRYLDRLLSETEGISPLTYLPTTTRHTYHVYMFPYDPVAFHHLPKNKFADALLAEGISGVMGGYTHPLYNNPVFLEKNFMGGPYPLIPAIYPKELDYADFEKSCPVVERACVSEAIWLTQNMLMGDQADIEDIYQAIKRIQLHSAQIV